LILLFPNNTELANHADIYHGGLEAAAGEAERVVDSAGLEAECQAGAEVAVSGNIKKYIFTN
jgi:hypothetical protein